jgi:putative FmdB family regulatory protein
MSVQEYQCNKCKNNFAAQDSYEAETEPTVRCPVCGSTDMESLGPHAGITGFLRPRTHFI